MPPSSVDTIQIPSAIGQSLFQEKGDGIVHPWVILDAQLCHNPQSVQKIVAIVQGVVQPQKIKQHNRIILVRPVDLMFE
jgi:hypothetical protein